MKNEILAKAVVLVAFIGVALYIVVMMALFRPRFDSRVRHLRDEKNTMVVRIAIWHRADIIYYRNYYCQPNQVDSVEDAGLKHAKEFYAFFYHNK